MSDSENGVVIVGAGQAGGWVALTIRECQPDRPVTLIGEEGHPPYERPPLSKDVLAGKAAPDSAYLKPMEHYAAAGIDLRLNTRVEAIDRASGAVRLTNGEILHYGTLVLATGMRPRSLPIEGADHPRVRVLRAMHDLDPIRDQLAPGRRIVAIGAGFIGLEIASVAATSGAEVTVLEAAPQALGRVVAPEVAAAIVHRHERRGVRFRFGVGITRISDDAGAPLVHLASGEVIAADLVIVGVGGQPNEELAITAGLICEAGICVDEHGRTSDPSIFAVGDVCRRQHPALGRSVRLESWQNAQNQGIAVGKEIAGVREPWSDVPWFWTDQYEDNFQIIGAPLTWDEVLWRGNPDDDRFTAIYLSQGRVLAGNTLNNARDIRPLKKLIVERTLVDPRVLTDTTVPLVKLVKQANK